MNPNKPEIKNENLFSKMYKRTVIWGILTVTVGCILAYYVISGFTFSLQTLVITFITFLFGTFVVIFIFRGIKTMVKSSTKKEIPKSRYSIIRKITIILFILVGLVLLLGILHKSSFLLELWISGLFCFFGGVDYILIYKGHLNIWWNWFKLPEDILKQSLLLQGIFLILVGLFLLLLAVMETFSSL